MKKDVEMSNESLVGSHGNGTVTVSHDIEPLARDGGVMIADPICLLQDGLTIKHCPLNQSSPYMHATPCRTSFLISTRNTRPLV